MGSILCVDDDPSVGGLLTEALRRMEHEPTLVTSVGDAVAAVGERSFDLILSDFRMPGGSGLDLIARLEKAGLQIPVIIMTGFSTIEHAVESMRSGAFDYLTKPIRIETLRIAVTRALEMIRLRRENAAFKEEISALRVRRTLVGESAALRRVLDLVDAVSSTKATALLEGESGTGKELVARAIHDRSQRRDAPFVTINCAALPEGLVESILFGHERGAFTGATVAAQGAFERADGGTLFLDEISEMRLDLQSKLLRVIEQQEFERVGGQRLINVDVRIIAATNRDLGAEAQAGRFRQDLYYRLKVVPIRLPPLRERLEDVSALVHHFGERAASQLGMGFRGVDPDAILALQRRSWPGNIRELANAVERAVILSRGGSLSPEAFVEDTPAPVATAAAASAPILNLTELEWVAIRGALERTGGNRTKAAGLLGISERTLRKKLNQGTGPPT